MSAWEQEWWGLARQVGDQVAAVIGADKDEITMLTHATQCHWVALSTQFKRSDRSRRKIIMTDQDFPSSIYAVSQIAAFMGWEIDKIESAGTVGVPWERIAERIDERTLLVATSHVHFRSAYIQDIAALSAYAHEKGAMTLIDAYHAPGTIPVEVRALDVDFYIGGCLKWLCGGPGNAFLYVNPDRAVRLVPELTGWMAHTAPFDFSQDVDITQGAYRFMSGTPPVACLYTATAGLEMIQAVGIEAIRTKSQRQTGAIIEWAQDQGYQVLSPKQEEMRAGAVSLGMPEAQRIHRALEGRGIKVDFRKGRGAEADILRVGPHFYTEDSELEHLFAAIESVVPR
ncbi:MAG: aminotransferase class V-fold PLP-dependent enzyme [Candidatus Aminicenantes bacterium]|nr:aminotransferase class V-fold PLP-dependent enzyme [Candidatus Aminicenantes bacterium]